MSEFMKPEDWDKDSWSFLKERCMKCWKLNKDRRKPRKNANSYRINLCPKHKKDFMALVKLMKEHKLPPLKKPYCETKEKEGIS